MAKKKRLKNNVKILIIFVIVLILIVALVLLSEQLTKAKSNPPGTLGNTGGNINNEGLFCQDGDTVYFVNSHDNYSIYSMNADGSDQKCVLPISVRYLNCAGDYIYYNQIDTASDLVYGFTGNVHGIYRYKKGTKNDTKGFDRTAAGELILIDDYLYYQHYDNDSGMTLYRSSINGTDKGEVCKEIVNPACVINGNIYYPDQNNYFKLNVFNTDTLVSQLYVDERMYQPVYSNGYIYYIGVGNNYELRRYNFSDNTIETISKDRIDRFNILGDIIFYQRNSTDTPALIRMSSDGSNSRVVAMGNYTNINMTSTYTYFYDFDDDQQIYRVSTAGEPKVEEFLPLVVGETPVEK